MTVPSPPDQLRRSVTQSEIRVELLVSQSWWLQQPGPVPPLVQLISEWKGSGETFWLVSLS